MGRDPKQKNTRQQIGKHTSGNRVGTGGPRVGNPKQKNHNRVVRFNVDLKKANEKASH